MLLALLALLLAFLLRKKRRLLLSLVPLLCGLLLLFKIGDAIYLVKANLYYPPYEISHLAYYVVPLLICSGIPGSDFAAGSLSFIVGVGFLLGAFIRPDALIANMNLYETIRLLITHELFFFLAWPLLFSFRLFPKKNYGAFLAMMAGFVTYFLLLRYHVIYPDRDYSSSSIALQVMDGSLIRYLDSSYTLGLQILFACSCILLVFAVPFLLLVISRALFLKKPYQHRELPMGARYGLWPFIQRKKKRKAFSDPSSWNSYLDSFYR